MPRPKRAKTKGPKGPDGQPSNGALTENGPAEVAVADVNPTEELRPPTSPVETSELPQPEYRSAQHHAGGQNKAADDKDHIAATSLNIAKLQAMSMMELNQMARELAVENFGTM